MLRYVSDKRWICLSNMDQIFSDLRAPQVFQLLVVQATSARVPRAPRFLTQRLFHLLGCLPWYKQTIPLPQKSMI